MIDRLGNTYSPSQQVFVLYHLSSISRWISPGPTKFYYPDIREYVILESDLIQSDVGRGLVSRDDCPDCQKRLIRACYARHSERQDFL